MSIFVMTWPGKPDIALVDETTAAHAEDCLRSGSVRTLRVYGTPQVQEVERGVLLTFHPVQPIKHVGEEPATVSMVTHLGVARSRPEPRFADARTAWFDFQERVGELLERYPALMECVPPVVRASWDDGTTSILDVLVEVGERVVADLVSLEPGVPGPAEDGG